MTGRELIIYILQNNLEDEQIIKDGRILGFITVDEAAVKFNVTAATIKVWCFERKLPYVSIGGIGYIPVNAELLKDKINEL